MMNGIKNNKVSKSMYKKMIKCNKLSEDFRLISTEIGDYMLTLEYDKSKLYGNPTIIDTDEFADSIMYGSGNKEEVDNMLKTFGLKVDK